MSGKRTTSAAAVAAVALHDYARPPPPLLPPQQHSENHLGDDDDDITNNEADDEHDDAKGNAVSSVGRKSSSLESLGMAISTKSQSRKEPLPMKLRALPRSFWEQPNTNQSPSPGYLFAPLPPLAREDNLPEGSGSHPTNGNNRVVDGSGSGSTLDPLPTPCNGRGIVSPADTDLLFSLFRAVERRDLGKKVTTVRRGRPRRSGNLQSQQRQVRDDDPCLVSSVTEQLLPTLTTRASSTPVLTMVSLRGGGSRASSDSLSSRTQTVALPCLQLNSSYSQILSELVVKL